MDVENFFDSIDHTIMLDMIERVINEKNDLMEELRSPVIDRLVLYLVNKSIIKKASFKSGSKGVLMEDRARNSFLANYDNFMTSPFLDIRTKKSINYRKVLQQRVYEIEKTVLNNYDYKPFVLYT